MDLWQVSAALVSAILHAGWNAAVKASPQPRQAMTAQMLASAALAVPGLLWTGLPAPDSLIWIAASTALNLVTVTALLRAYESCGFGLAYPIVRAVSVLLVVPLAAGVSGETLSLTSLAGIGLIAASLLLLAAGNFGPGAVPVTAFAWICLAAAATAAYVFCDAQGARWAGSPWAYGLLVCITNALALAWTQRRTAPPWRLLADHWTMAVPSAVAAMTSYLLILWVWSGAPIAPAAALRDTSAIFAVVIAVLWLGEPFTRLRLAAILLSAAAVPLLRFA